MVVSSIRGSLSPKAIVQNVPLLECLSKIVAEYAYEPRVVMLSEESYSIELRFGEQVCVVQIRHMPSLTSHKVYLTAHAIECMVRHTRNGPELTLPGSNHGECALCKRCKLSIMIMYGRGKSLVLCLHCLGNLDGTFTRIKRRHVALDMMLYETRKRQEREWQEQRQEQRQGWVFKAIAGAFAAGIAGAITGTIVGGIVGGIVSRRIHKKTLQC